jgi:hypothetical protein
VYEDKILKILNKGIDFIISLVKKALDWWIILCIMLK